MNSSLCDILTKTVKMWKVWNLVHDMNIGKRVCIVAYAEQQTNSSQVIIQKCEIVQFRS